MAAARGARTSASRRRPSAVLRKEFTAAKTIAVARLYVSALGLYEIHSTAPRSATTCLRPAGPTTTSASSTQTYDVTEPLKQGDNAIGAMLGDGWYAGARLRRAAAIYGDEPRPARPARDRLRRRHQHDRRHRRHVEGGSGPMRADDLLDGETYDARLEQARLGRSRLRRRRLGRSVAERRHETHRGRAEPGGRRSASCRSSAGDGQNRAQPACTSSTSARTWSAGPRLKVTAPAGTTVTLRHAEMLNPDGTLYTTNLRGARATDTYT